MKVGKYCGECIYYDNRYKTCRSTEELANYGDCISILSDKVSDQSIEIENLKRAMYDIIGIIKTNELD